MVLYYFNGMIYSTSPMPKISCLLVTANDRFEYFCKSCQCYFDQTYPNKELVVVNEGTPEYQQKMKEFLVHRTDVKFVYLNGKYSLGALRNISIAMASGDVFVQWDDDDYNMPERLIVQFNHLKKHPKANICYLTDQLHYYFNTMTIYWNDWKQYHSGGSVKYSLIPGTIMAYKDKFVERYPSYGENCSAGEDSVLSDKLVDDHLSEITLLSDFGYLHVYTFHGKNVWDHEHHMYLSKARSKSVDQIIPYRNKICVTLDYLRFDLIENSIGGFKVMGRDGLAFLHGVNK